MVGRGAGVWRRALPMSLRHNNLRVTIDKHVLPLFSLQYVSLSMFKIFQLLLCSGGLAISGWGGQQLVSAPLTKN